MAKVRLSLILILGSLLFLGLSNAATYVAIQGPVNYTIYNNGSVYLGKVGPGESFYVLANASTTNKTGYLVNLGWDTLTAIKLPNGWYAQQSPSYSNPMRIRITVSPNSTNGRYPVILRAVNFNNYSRLGNLTFTIYVNVSTNVFSVNVNSNTLYSGVNQPVNINININNTGISDDPFLIYAQGLPSWNVTDSVISLHGKNTHFSYPVFIGQPGKYYLNLTVSSSSSRFLKRSYPILFQVNTTIYNDYKALGSGISISPVIFEPAYAFMSLIQYLYSLMFH
ncbi:MAG: hypothetical protein QXD23_02265 [Candidatus Micrarchaeaceae archaeon]